MYGIDGETNIWIGNFVSDRSQSVLVERAFSGCDPVITGVLQGSVTGPCLFLFYINDIADSLTSTVRLFAHNTMIYLAAKSEEDSKAFQKDLDELAAWGT